MGDSRMTRFDEDLFEAAVDEGRREHRSARQQLEHWASLGREVSAHETAARHRIVAAVRGERPMAGLSPEERLVANAELDLAVRERAGAAAFGRSVLRAGAVAVALNEHGVLTEIHPDGTSRPLDVDRQPEWQAVRAASRRPG
ncbi:MAG: TA system antitoxin ParD family protein [Acidimicrobiales bacterium]